MNTDSDVEQWCRILEIERTATPEDIKRAHREIVKVWHPDRFTNDTRLQQKAQEKLKQINWAYECLQEFLKSDRTAERGASAQRPRPEKDPRVEGEEFFQRGSSLYFGNSAPKNPIEAARWLRKSAEMGLDKAQALFGYMHYKGEGVPKDAHEATRWLKMAAEHHNPLAYYWLGCIHAEGFGSNILHKAVRAGIDWQLGDSKIEAYKYFNLAATYGCPEALERIPDVSICMTQGQINEARTRAAKFYPPYREKPPRQVIAEWLNTYVQELVSDPKRIAWCAQVVSALKRFQGLEVDVAETTLRIFQDKFFANRANKASNFLKAVGAAWIRTTREDHSRYIANRLVEDAYGFSPNYICTRENFINQLWLKIYAGR